MKDIKDFENYSVDENGNVFSKKRNAYLKPALGRDGYFGVLLCNNGKRKNFKVHRLVAIAFLPNPNNLPQVNHKDENKQNNNVENLEWCDARYNLTYGNRINKATKKRKENDPLGKSYIKSMETRKKNNPNNECFKRTVETRTLKKCVNAEKKIAQYDKDGKLINTFKSIAEAAEKTN